MHIGERRIRETSEKKVIRLEMRKRGTRKSSRGTRIFYVSGPRGVEQLPSSGDSRILP